MFLKFELGPLEDPQHKINLNKTSKSPWRKHSTVYIISDRNRSIGGSDMQLMMRPAGGAVNLDPNARKPTVDDGKTRLFGLSDENAMPTGYAPEGQ